MKQLSKLAAAAAIAMSMFGSAHAETVVNNWFFNPTGVGGAAAGVLVNEYLDVVGNGFVDITPTVGQNFSFDEWGVFSVSGRDGLPGLPGYTGEITAVLNATGAGTFSNGFNFSGGTLDVYADTTPDYGTTVGTFGADNGTLIASFEIIGGGGAVDASGNPVSNGQVVINVKASPGDLTPGYWFSPVPSGDLSSVGTFAFAFTNANNAQSPSTTLVSELVCGLATSDGFGGGAGFCPSGVGYTQQPGDFLVINNNGQFKLAVPEPGSIALVGLALLAAGGIRRKTKA